MGTLGDLQVYTQHVPLLINTLDTALKGKLKESVFPAVGPFPTAAPRSVVVFVIGGCTYEEGTKVAEMNSSGTGIKIILGGTVVHNSNTFLRELAAL